MTAKSARLWGLVAAIVTVSAVAVVGGGTPSAGASRCFGAAARDPAHPCVNPTRSVFGLTEPDAPASTQCRPANEGPVRICSFGTAPAKAAATFALVGDSHALHWRPALDVVARANGWRGLAVTTSGCYFSEAAAHFLEGARQACTSWTRSVLAWFHRHPEVSTVFVSQFATTPVTVGPGETYFGIKTAGFRKTWRALPKTVKHVIVIRDVPESSNPQFNCIEKVVAAGKERPGPACLLPRSSALKLDTAVATVRSLRSRRYQSVDLTDFFCGSRNCYGVIGGVLVHSDVDHITAAYSTTLGPYLLRKVRKLMASW
jgi:hypothetical protein